MLGSPQTIQMSRDRRTDDATIAWRYEGGDWVVTVQSAEFDPVDARANDAFEALCLVREQLEPQGWRLGVAGSQLDVWPSGMARDQGGGKVAYRSAGGVVSTFEPVDPASVVTVAEQQAEAERLLGQPVR